MSLKLKKDQVIIILTFIVGFLGLVFYANSTIMYGVITLECFLLIICLICGRNEMFLCLLLSFISMSQEFAYFLENGTNNVVLFSFKETRIFGLNLGLIFLVAFFLKILFFDNALNRLDKSGHCYNLIKWILVLAVLSLIVGGVNILIDSNGIASLPNVWKEYIQEWSYTFYVTLFVFIMTFVIDNYGSYMVERTIWGIMRCNLVLPLFANVMGIVGTYGGKELYLTLSSYMLCTLILIFPCYQKYKNKSIVCYFLYGIGVLFPIIFRSMAFGKLLMIIAFGVLLFLFLKSSKSLKWILMAIVIVIAIVCGWSAIISTLTTNNALFGYKYKQVISMLSIWNEGWYENMLPSPKVRITEFINICIELVKNPLYLLIGKGTLGTVKDYMGQIQPFNLSIYSYNEFAIGAFFGMHESINIFLLSNGLIGLLFLIRYITVISKNVRKNPYIVIGGIWLILLWGYSITRATLGIACLCMGLAMLDNKYSAQGE